MSWTASLRLVPLWCASATACSGGALSTPPSSPVVVWASEYEASGNHVQRIARRRAATTHPDADLSVILLAGRLEIDVAGDRVTLDEGESVHVPHGTVYSMRNVAAGPSSLFLMFRPVRYDPIAHGAHPPIAQ